MAVIKKGILGGFSGKIGDLVGYNRNGKSIIQSRPVQGLQPNRFNIGFFNANRNYLQIMWDLMPAYVQNTFTVYSVNGESKFDTFVRFQKLISGYNKISNYKLSLYGAYAGYNFPVVDIIVHKLTGYAKATFNTFITSPKDYSKKGFYASLYYGNTYVKALLNAPDGFNEPFSVEFSDPLIGLESYYIRFRINFTPVSKDQFFNYPTWF